MTDNAPEAVMLSAATCMLLDGRFVSEADYRAVCAERDMAKEGWAESQELIRKARLQYSEEKARAEAAEAAIVAALERLNASLFTNAEHRQAKDILRGALKPRQE